MPYWTTRRCQLPMHIVPRRVQQALAVRADNAHLRRLDGSRDEPSRPLRPPRAVRPRRHLQPLVRTNIASIRGLGLGLVEVSLLAGRGHDARIVCRCQMRGPVKIGQRKRNRRDAAGQTGERRMKRAIDLTGLDRSISALAMRLPRAIRQWRTRRVYQRWPLREQDLAQNFAQDLARAVFLPLAGLLSSARRTLF